MPTILQLNIQNRFPCANCRRIALVRWKESKRRRKSQQTVFSFVTIHYTRAAVMCNLQLLIIITIIDPVALLSKTMDRPDYSAIAYLPSRRAYSARVLSLRDGNEKFHAQRGNRGGTRDPLRGSCAFVRISRVTLTDRVSAKRLRQQFLVQLLGFIETDTHMGNNDNSNNNKYRIRSS